MDADLLTPILLGTKNINFFEGRLLSARDLREEQAANRDHDRRLGRAIGAGIIDGLEVELVNDGADGNTPLVTVKQGLALNHEGEVIGLAENDVRVALSRTFDVKPTSEADFYACAGPPSSTFLATGVGLYMLAVTPAAGFKERAPKIGLGDEGVVKGCGSRYVQEGVRFRLVELTTPLLTTLEGLPEDTVNLLNNDLLSASNPVDRGDDARLSRLRSAIAHLCIGTDRFAEESASSFHRMADIATKAEYGAVARLRASGNLRSCDVPLTLLYWTLEGLAFLDAWSVRRLAIDFDSRQAVPGYLGIPSIRQFQEHFSELNLPTDAQLQQYFLYLPPVGVLPTRNLRFNSESGVDIPRFFGSRVNRMASIIDASQTSALVQLAMDYPPSAVVSQPTTGVFNVAQNVRAVLGGQDSQLYTYFTLPQVGLRFCSRATFIGNADEVSQGEIRSLFEATHTVLQEFRRIVFLFGLATSATVSREDNLGLQAVDQAQATVSSAVTALAGECAPNDAVYRWFQHVANQQRYLIRLWRELVLPPPNGDRYRSEIHDLIEEVDHFIDDVEFQGFRGLITALADTDVTSAYLTQQRILQSFSLTIGTGARGVIALEYTTAPVAPPDSGGNGDVPAPVLAPGEYIFGYTLNGRISEAATFLLNANVEAFGWRVDLLDESGADPRPSNRLTIPKGDETPDGASFDLRVRLTVPSGGPDNAVLSFVVRQESGAGGVPPAREDILLEIGQPIPVPDIRVSVRLTSYGNPGQEATPANGGISIPSNRPTAIDLGIRSEVPGRFSATVEVLVGGDWEFLQLRGNPEDFGSSTAPFGEVFSLEMLPGDQASNTDLLISVASRTDSTPPVDPPVLERYRLPVLIQG